MLETPDKIVKSAKNERQKAINSRALVVKKAVFSNENATSKVPSTPKVNSTSKAATKNNNKVDEQDWYCAVCQVAKISDMRLCVVCQKYVHEECVGLTKEMKDIFVCPLCE